MSAVVKLTAPGSKSMTQRALLLGALRARPTVVRRALVCDDSRYLTDALVALGARIRWQESSVHIEPTALRANGQTLFCGNAGTAVRFGACLSLLLDGAFTIDGDAHMRRRPLGPLCTSLEQLGVRCEPAAGGCPPVTVQRRVPAPAEVSVDTSLSSQYASGLLMVAPCLPQGLTVHLTGDLVSMPYLHMTVAMMQQAGARAGWQGDTTVRVEPGGYPGDDPCLDVEPDWSGAAFLLAASRLAGVRIELDGLLSPDASLQGDAAFATMLRTLDEPGPYSFDLTDVPDLIAPLAAASLFASGPTRIRGAAHTRIKECDRVAVLSRELTKLGAVIDARPDGLDIEPLRALPSAPVRLDPEADHRMAMTFGVVSLRVPGIEVTDPGCVSKSFPGFWDTLARIRAAAGSD